MTKTAIRDAFESLRDDAELRPLEDAARSRSESDWLIGMNATRAATTRIGSPRSPISLGRVQTPTLALIVRRDLEITAFVPEDYWQVQAQFDTAANERYIGMWQQGSSNRLKTRRGGRAHRRARAGRRRGRRVGRAQAARRAVAAPVRPHHAAARGEPALRLHRQAHARRGPGLLRAPQGARPTRVPNVALHLDRPRVRRCPASSRASSPPIRSTRRPPPRSPASRSCRRRARSTTPRSATITRSSRPTRSTRSSGLSSDERRIYDIVARRFLAIFHPAAESEQTVVWTAIGDEQFRSRGKVLSSPAGARRTARRCSRPRRASPRRTPSSACRARPRARPSPAARQRRSPSRRSRRRATTSPRCCVPWRPPASSSRTTRPPRR